MWTLPFLSTKQSWGSKWYRAKARPVGLRFSVEMNGGDPTQEGCFFEVDNAEAAFDELKSNGLEKEDPGFRIDQHGKTAYKVFFIVAPDGLCYCLGERV